MRQGARTDLEPSVNSQKVSQNEASTMMGVGTWSINKAKKVLTEGTPELAGAATHSGPWWQCWRESSTV
jgi:hypothetical protein